MGIARAAAFAAALLCGAFAVYLLARRPPALPRWTGIALVLTVGLLLMAPSTLLQLGLRDATAPWFFTNDSTYQAELGGDLVLHLDNPYGHDYRESGLERFYTRDGSVSERVREKEVALEHFAYFPGAVITAAAWDLLPKPFDDYRLLVLFATLALLPAALLFRGPLEWRLVLGAVLVCNPIAVRSAWFGQNDAPSLLLLVLAFALVTTAAIRLGRSGDSRRDPAEAVRDRRAAVPRPDGPARGVEARGPRAGRRAGRGHPALPRAPIPWPSTTTP